ncbi:MAG: hypothetical protein O2948_00265 [Proteobacteria bacterium]|nr:hypothetical protein [Pseudomonadota bacterium]
MRKAVWISFSIALVLVNAIAEIGNYYTGIEIHMFLRIAIIFGVTMGTFVFTGSFALINAMDSEKPLAGTVRNTLGADRKKDPEP